MALIWPKHGPNMVPILHFKEYSFLGTKASSVKMLIMFWKQPKYGPNMAQIWPQY